MFNTFDQNGMFDDTKILFTILNIFTFQIIFIISKQIFYFILTWILFVRVKDMLLFLDFNDVIRTSQKLLDHENNIHSVSLSLHNTEGFRRWMSTELSFYSTVKVIFIK